MPDENHLPSVFAEASQLAENIFLKLPSPFFHGTTGMDAGHDQGMAGIADCPINAGEIAQFQRSKLHIPHAEQAVMQDDWH
jgi:hypothetical protein